MNNRRQGPVGGRKKAEQLLTVCGVKSAAQPPSAALALPSSSSDQADDQRRQVCKHTHTDAHFSWDELAASPSPWSFLGPPPSLLLAGRAQNASTQEQLHHLAHSVIITQLPFFVSSGGVYKIKICIDLDPVSAPRRTVGA